MRYLYYLTPLFCSMLACQSPFVGEQKNTIEVVSFLADDALAGRQNGTPDAQKAAQFIASHFQKAGLKPYQDTSFFQKFAIYQIKLHHKNLSINHFTLSEKDFFFTSQQKKVRLSSANAPTYYIKAEDDFVKKFHQYRQSTSAIIFVDTLHRKKFEQHQHFYEQMRNSFDTSELHGQVWAIGNFPTSATWQAGADYDIELTHYQNIVGKLEGKTRSKEIVLFSAHYDHLGILKGQSPDSIANGANDNASGVAALIQLAYRLAQQKNNQRSLVFVAFAAEETGSYGAQYFVRQIVAQDYAAVINLEMLGKAFAPHHKTLYLTGFNRSTLGNQLAASLGRNEWKILPDPYPHLQLFYRSDNICFAQKGIAAHTIFTTDIAQDPDYHQASDQINHIDFEHLNASIEAILNASQGIISGRHTPSLLP